MPEEIRPDSLAQLAAVLAAVQATTKRLEKRRVLVEYLRSLPQEALPHGARFLCGRPFPRCDIRKLSLGGATFSSALMSAHPTLTGEELNAAWLRHSDAGDTAWDVWRGEAPMGTPLTLAELADLFDALYRAKGPTAKIPLLAEAFRRMDAEEIRAFVKIMLSEPRIGAQEGTIEDAVAHAFDLPLDDVRAANRHRADLGSVAVDARLGTLEVGGFAFFTPVDPMLAHPVEGPDEAIKRLGTPVWVEDKYDGIRCQLHKVDSEVRLYSRDRKEITSQFPEVIAAYAQSTGSYALDGELMALQDGRSLPFARLQQRLNRVAPTAEIVAAHPTAMVAFDLLACGDESLLDEPLRARRARLEAMGLPPGQHIGPRFTADSAESIERFFKEAQEVRGNEGLMCKDPESAYRSGRRGFSWLKVKKPLDTLDVVIVGAEWGHGKRRNVLSDYTFAVLDDRETTDAKQSSSVKLARIGGQVSLVTIGKAYGGLTDAAIAEMTERLKEITVQDFGRYRTVRPEIVLEVEFNGIQESKRHKSGYALRFPRIVRIRDDKKPLDANTLSDVETRYRASVGGIA
jgi:DNA ligase-1